MIFYTIYEWKIKCILFKVMKDLNNIHSSNGL